MRSDADQVYKKTNLSNDLNKIAFDNRLKISENRASGNCMFYALSEQLEHVKRIDVTHQELRETLVEFLRENPNLVSQKWCGPLTLRANYDSLTSLKCFRRSKDRTF